MIMRPKASDLAFWRSPILCTSFGLLFLYGTSVEGLNANSHLRYLFYSATTLAFFGCAIWQRIRKKRRNLQQQGLQTPPQERSNP
jgi:hypothetical protein